MNQTGKDRLEGWRQALEAAGLEPSAELIEEAHWTRVGGARGMTRLLDLDAPPTAIFGANYRSTIGALSVLRERGLRVPEDVSLVSFDDAEVFRLASPAITAIAQPIDLIARALAARVADICGKDAPATGPKEILPCTLIERASVAPPPNARTKGTQPNADS